MTDNTPERIQKVLAAAGVASRRQLETWITAGRITVNGEPASLGQRITSSDKIAIDGKPFVWAGLRRSRVLAYHKPIGEICTRHDPGGRATIFDRLPTLSGSRWISVGRLDINSSGLILLTTDGRLADALMRPASGVVREYRVRVLGTVSDSMLMKLKNGVDLDDGPAKFETVVEKGSRGGANRWFVCGLREGRNREVRRLWEAVGCQVNRLIRTRYGSVHLPADLAPGKHVELDARGIDALYRCAGVSRGN